MPEVCPFIIEWEAVQLFIDSNFHDSIFKEIADVYFPNLTVLSAFKNEIESIEILSRIRLPQLYCMNIGNNKITNTKPIRKMDCPQLTILNISQNMISEALILTDLSAKSLG